MKIPRSLTVLVDSREKYPLLFPAHIDWYPSRGGKPKKIVVCTDKRVLEAGDYALEEYAYGCIIERKGSLRELHQNLLTDDYKRFKAAIERLAEACRYPYLLLDMTPADLHRPTEHVESPAEVVDALMEFVHRYGLRLWFAGSCKQYQARRILGEQVVRVILAHSLRDEESEILMPDAKIISQLTKPSADATIGRVEGGV